MSTDIVEHRARKPPVSYIIPKICYPRKRKRFQKKTIPQQSAFRIIPCPLKFIYHETIYFMYGDINLIEHEGTLVTNTNFLNRTLTCKEIRVVEQNDQKLVQLKLDANSQFEYPPWQVLVEKLKDSQCNGLKRWGNIVEDYVLGYEDMLRSQCNKQAVLSVQEELQHKIVDEESRKRVRLLYNKYPCLNFRFKFTDNNIHNTEIISNDNYLHELGYSIESFSLQLIKEGIPPLLPKDNTDTIEVFLKNYRLLQQCTEFETSEYDSPITLKNGFLITVRYKIHYFPTFEDGIFGFDAVVMLTGKMPVWHLNSNKESSCKLNREFLDQMLAKEKEANVFLKKFYNTTIHQKYTSMNKVCKIKEIETMDSDDTDSIY